MSVKHEFTSTVPDVIVDWKSIKAWIRMGSQSELAVMRSIAKTKPITVA